MVLTPQQLDAIMPDASQLYSDEPEMESSLHYMQLLLLVTCLEWLWRDRNDYFIGANLTIYFSRQQLRNRDFHGPDFFLVKQTQKHPRNSWVVWEEDGKYPNLIIELLSTSTADIDRNLKKNLYQDRFHTPEYFYFSPDTLEFAGLRLVGSEYQDILPNGNGWRWSQELDLYLGIDSGKLRYFTSEGVLVPTPEETALQTQLELQQQNLELQQERQRAERLAERLRSLDIDLE
ncbi:Uma2 family endonuclease [Komarekiella sp. 'clone 1']|uniref:Uma2 family endonuclease n=1 Tax=Komarekiella delphini-convector SJRDD-AB1 TaxID=2593771 RepID=A0AA40VRE5_9NOST|nr:Uma2 family endonuclease [Komarekiella delphini-convector]MBD6617112.1 Uma2 family endonuclease [Komarekiella delphini-convector SJRDD-AB1]